MPGKALMRMGARRGANWEKAAAIWLEDRNIQVLERNWRGADGEVDIIAKENGVYLFVEVKQRFFDAYGTGIAAIDHDKRRRIRNAAAAYQKSKGITGALIRFDVIEITQEGVSYYPGAFTWE